MDKKTQTGRQTLSGICPPACVCTIIRFLFCGAAAIKADLVYIISIFSGLRSFFIQITDGLAF